MDFFHCNSCFAQPGPPKSLKFCLTSCGHTFCTNCLNLGSTKCKECQSDCKVLPLTKDMPPNLQLYFTDIVTETKKVVNILLLQNKHYQIYMEEYLPKLESKFSTTKSLLDKSVSEIELLKKKVNLLVTENEELKREISLFIQMKSKKYQDVKTPVLTSRDVLLGGSNKNYGSRGKSLDKKSLFKSSEASARNFLASTPPTNSFLNLPPRLTPISTLMENRSNLRDNMRMLNPHSAGRRIDQTYFMTSQQPMFSKDKLRHEAGSPGSWCSSLSSIKSPILPGKKSYFSKP